VETLESRVEELEGASSGAPEVEMEAGNPALGYFRLLGCQSHL